jgi:hypothetical protein
MAQPVQNFQNHTKTVPAFHMVTTLLLLVNFVWGAYRLVTDFSVDRIVTVLLAVALFLMFWFIRAFPLAVQDRVIRLEMRLRLAQLLPADLKPRINELTVGQLCSLRFASDAELPELTRKVLDGNIQDRKTIKQMIRTWEPDWLRA